MDQDCATKVAAKIREFDTWFNDLTALTMEMENQEGSEVRRALAEMLFDLDEGVRARVKRQFPDLISE